MPSLVKTLKNKASQSRLRNNQPTIHEEPLPDLPTHDYSSHSENSRKSFWRRRELPRPEVKSPNLTSLSPPDPPRSILRPHYASVTLPQDRRHTLVPYSQGLDVTVPHRPESARTSTPPNRDWRPSSAEPTQLQPRRPSVRWSPPLHAPKPVTPSAIPMLSSPISLGSPPGDSPPSSSSPQTPTTPVRQALPTRWASRPASSASSRILSRTSTASSDALTARGSSAASVSSRRKSSRPGSLMSYSTRSSIASISTLSSSHKIHVERPVSQISYYVIPQQPEPQPRPRSIARKPVPSLVDTAVPLPMKSSPTPSFNIIPPTPDAAGEAFENAAVAAPRPSTSSVRPSSVILLDTMHEEEEEEGAKTPRLEAPIKLETVKQLDSLDSEESSSDDCETPSEPELSDRSPKRPSPRRARSPPRKWDSLYGGYDDGRSISRSLAELAALACDLPPLDADLAEHAAHLSEAHKRFLAARALVDATESPDLSETPKARPTPTAPPVHPLPARPTTAPIIPPRSHRRPSVRSRKRAQSTDTFGSQGSVPSLVSLDSVPSVSSGLGSASSQSCMGSPDVEDATNVLRSMTLDGIQIPSTPKAQTKMPSSLPETPNPGLGLGLVLDVAGLAPHTPKHLRSSSEDKGTPSPPRRLPMVREDPRRSGFYGTPVASQSMSSIRSYLAGKQNAAARQHSRQGSVASSLASNISDDDELLSASIVAIPPGAVTHIVGREDPRSHEIGVAL